MQFLLAVVCPWRPQKELTFPTLGPESQPGAPSLTSKEWFPPEVKATNSAFQVTFPGLDNWASGNGVAGASMSLHPSLKPLKQDQQCLLKSTGCSPKSGPSYSTNLHHGCFSHRLREPKQLASGHTAGRQPRSAPETRSVRPAPKPEAASQKTGASWVLSTAQSQSGPDPRGLVKLRGFWEVAVGKTGKLF